MTENLSEKLEQLSAAATQTEDDIRYYSGGSKYNEPLEQLKNRLVHLYRTGQLVAVQADDAIERYRHVKRGTVYEVVGEAELQMNADNLVDGSQMMVYRGEDGKLWCRHYDEFHDGRFAALAAKGAGGE